jgi:Lrp/AsnC family transcriptional regulator
MANMRKFNSIIVEFGNKILVEKLDVYELRILALMQEDATLTTSDIADRIGLSQAPCWRRIDRLRREGFIRAQVALVDRRKVGLNAQIFAQVKLNAHGRQHLEEFSEAIRQFPEVLECYVLMGSVDFMLRIVARDIEAYERFFFNKLSQVAGIQEVNSVVALSEIKATTALPINQ